MQRAEGAAVLPRGAACGALLCGVPLLPGIKDVGSVSHEPAQGPLG